ncbi:MAG: YceI family protein [Acidimicrobiales bacterium]
MSTTTSTPTTRSWDDVTIPAPGTFAIDPSHTQVGFVARHMMVSKVRGSFTDYSGTIVVAEDPLLSTVEVEVQVASIDTRDANRDNHLRSGDFFEAESHPTLTFKSSKVEHGGGNDFTITGDLTIKGMTKPVVLDATFEGVVTDPYGNERLGFTASSEIDRFEFGLEWNSALETGGLVVGRKVKLEIEAEATRKP